MNGQALICELRRHSPHRRRQAKPELRRYAMLLTWNARHWYL